MLECLMCALHVLHAYVWAEWWVRLAKANGTQQFDYQFVFVFVHLQNLLTIYAHSSGISVRAYIHTHARTRAHACARPSMLSLIHLLACSFTPNELLDAKIYFYFLKFYSNKSSSASSSCCLLYFVMMPSSFQFNLEILFYFVAVSKYVYGCTQCIYCVHGCFNSPSSYT